MKSYIGKVIKALYKRFNRECTSDDVCLIGFIYLSYLADATEGISTENIPYDVNELKLNLFHQLTFFG